MELSNEKKIELISGHFSEIMKVLGLDLSDLSLCDTPTRVAKMYVNELFAGLSQECPKITVFPNDEGYNQMLIVRDSAVYSCCEHHWIPFIGKAQVAYIPKDKIIGLSKVTRIVDYYSRRPQVQERLTQQIAKHLQDVLKTKDVAVVISAVHNCCVMRGVKDPGTSTISSFMGGVFHENATARNELMTLINTRI